MTTIDIIANKLFVHRYITICPDPRFTWHENLLRITDPLIGETTDHWWIPLTEGQ